MKFILVLIYDKVAGMYSSPLIYDNIECAKRHFYQLIKNQPNLNGDDYELYFLGYYDPKIGIVYDKDDCETCLSVVPLAVYEGGLNEKEE